MNTDAKL
jgi:flagellar biosynthesis/type III secretory pathway M-ring protein FliF/YscJ